MLRRMGLRHGGRLGDGPEGKKMTAIEMACLNPGMVCGRGGPRTGPHRMRRGRINTEVCHILLLPAGLADGLGREVACPTAFTKNADSPPKIGSPASPF
jgi:hypothetical protein